MKKYVATHDAEVLNTIYELQKERLSTKPVPYVRVVKSMMYLLSRTRPEIPAANPEGFAEGRFVKELESAGFFEEMNRAVRKVRSDGGDMKHLRKFLEGGMLGLVVLLSFVAPGHPAELKKLTLGYSTVGPAGTGLWMAKEIGAFEKYGIDADLIFISSGPVVVQALIGGDLQAGLAATNAVIAAVLGGAPLVSVMSLVNRPYYRLWVQPEITRLEELRGKTLGVSRFGSVTDNLTRILLRKKGLDGAVNVRQMGGTTEMAAAFQRRQIAGAVTSNLRVDAPMRMLVDLDEMDIQYSNVVIAVSRDFHRRSPETVEAIRARLYRGCGGSPRSEGKSAQGHCEIYAAQGSEDDGGIL